VFSFVDQSTKQRCMFGGVGNRTRLLDTAQAIKHVRKHWRCEERISRWTRITACRLWFERISGMGISNFPVPAFRGLDLKRGHSLMETVVRGLRVSHKNGCAA
jgi:hypothetical protein